MEQKHDLKSKQALPLDIKILMTKRRIDEYYRNNYGKVAVSFSGGKDSTVLLHIARQVYPDIQGVYCNTGLEYPEINEFVREFDNIITVRPKYTFKHVLEKYGYPIISKEVAQHINDIKTSKSQKLIDKLLFGFINRKGERTSFGKLSNKWRFMLDAPFKISANCCKVIKKNPLKSYSKKNNIHYILGNLAEESRLRKQTYSKHGCFVEGKTNSYLQPIAFWTEQDVWDYIKLYNIKICPIYDKLTDKRTGCIFCMFGIQYYKREHLKFDVLKELHPKLYDYCMNDLKLKEILDWFYANYKGGK